jgi:hypothetical protein
MHPKHAAARPPHRRPSAPPPLPDASHARKAASRLLPRLGTKGCDAESVASKRPGVGKHSMTPVRQPAANTEWAMSVAQQNGTSPAEGVSPVGRTDSTGSPNRVSRTNSLGRAGAASPTEGVDAERARKRAAKEQPGLGILGLSYDNYVDCMIELAQSVGLAMRYRDPPCIAPTRAAACLYH